MTDPQNISTPAPGEAGSPGGRAAEFERSEAEGGSAPEALRLSEARYRSLVELAPDIIYCLAADGSILFISSSVEALGYRREELIGRRFEEIVHPDDVAKARNRFVERRISARGTRDLEVRLLTKGGGVRAHAFNSVDVSVSARGLWDVPDEQIKSPNKKFLGTQGIARDITERKRTEEALEAYARELARSNAELEAFAHAVSHDLQGPLATVVSLLDLLSESCRGRLDADANEIIRQVVSGAGRMQTLVRDLLAYARVGKQGQEKAPIDCRSVLEKALANLQQAIDEAGAEVTHGPLPTVTAYETQLIALFQNLIDNGIKFNEQNPPEVRVEAEDGPEEWIFSVSDNGIGMDPKDAERIFSMFQRLNDREAYAGSGIGLATCKKIVEQHGGQISAESQPGSGSTLRFTLPKTPSE